MPRQVIEHETWCTEHNDEMSEPMCVSKMLQFGPPDESEHADPDWRVGYLYVSQQGTEGADVAFYYPTNPHGMDAMFGTGVLRMLVTALDADPTGTIAALRDALALYDQEAS